jgi:molecular chaperone DnaJ
VASRLELTFEEAAFGVEKEVSATRIENCAKCSGTGSADGAVESCTRCGGSGQIRTTQNFMGMTMQSTAACPVCSGRGKVIKTPCTTCKGKGKVRRTQKVSVKVPAGVDEGQMVRVHGQGNVGSNGGPAGDLLVEILIKRHKLFERDGADVLCELPISFTQAALGAEIEIPTLDGRVTYTIPEGTQTGTTFRLRDKGIPYVNNRTRRGDQLVTVVVETPTRLNREQKELLKQFEESLGVTPKRKKFFDTIKDIFE